MSRYVVIGAGASGVTLAAELHRVRRQVVLVARGRQLRAAESGGMFYVRPGGARPLGVPIADGPTELTLTGDDVLVLATKTQHVAEAVARWAWQPVRLPDETAARAGDVLPLVTPQSGLEAERIALREFRTVIAAALTLPAQFTEPGVVIAPGAPAVGHAWIGAWPDRPSPAAEAIAADFAATELIARAVTDVTRYKHGKLVLSAGFVLDALYAPSALRDRASSLLRQEARTVLEAAGHAPVDLHHELAEVAWPAQPQSLDEHSYGGTSTWQSMSRDASIETDFLNGEIVLQARLAGQAAPAHAAMVSRIHAARRRRLPARSLGDADLAATLPQLAAGDEQPRRFVGADRRQRPVVALDGDSHVCA